MITNVTIPAELIPDVRDGLLSSMGDAAEAIMQALEQPEGDRPRGWLQDDREQLGSVFSLLDLVGWDGVCDRGDVEVDLREHGPILKRALDGYLPLLEDQQSEAALNDRRRVAEGRAPRKAEIAARTAAFREFAVILERRLTAPGA